MKRTRIREILHMQPTDTLQTVCGWVRTRRDSKSVAFLEINDGSCLRSLQVIVEPHHPLLTRCTTGASVRVVGTLQPSPAAGQPVELHTTELEILGDSPAEFPLQKKRHSFEFLREIAHLRTRSNTFGAVFRVRNILAREIHNFFQSRGFVYLHAPIITTSDCEGAGEMFQVTTLDIEKPPRLPSGNIDYTQDFFGRKASLTVSGQLEAEVFACSLGDTYTFGPTFRAENSNTSRHLAEFWMIEPEIAFADLCDDMDLAEDFILHLVRFVLSEGSEDLAFFDRMLAPGQLKMLEQLAQARFARMTYTEAIEHLVKVADRFDFRPSWGSDLQSEHERYLTEEVVGGPLFVTDYPKEIKAFYMRVNEDNKTVAAMDLLVPRVGEIIGGSQREERFDVLQSRIRELGLPEENYWWYLDLRRYGTVAHAGFGLGFERMVQFVTGMTNIRDVIPFPRTPGNAVF